MKIDTALYRVRCALSRLYRKYRPLYSDKYLEAAGDSRKLHLGCGHDYREGFVNLDRGNCRADVNHDMNIVPYPFEDDSFGYIFASHALEHLDRRRWLDVVKELYRISAHGAIWEFKVPYAMSDNFLTDPTHSMPFTPRSFDYFDRTRALSRLGSIYGFGIDLRVLEGRLVKNEQYGPDVYFAIRVLKGG